MSNHEHKAEHEQEMRELSDEELEQVAGGAILRPCQCPRCLPPAEM